ncbi:MAG TPA: thiamine phosphate synthase [Pontiellaceae bacterium]|nr:thiamine phosphate synthase [Pontiellaceae bacterium]HPR83685.1 thiamine phosphate synthase [Pontiellaceae bacterium]
MKENFGLYMVMTDPVTGYEACAQAAVNCGLRYVQLRMKNASRAAILAEARKVRAVTVGTRTLFIMNDDVELAWAADADGVHLGQGDMPLDEARRLWNAPGKIFGLSTHSEAQELAARALRPDYIGVGPVFPTPTKAIADPALGIERAGTIIKNSPLPCVALGGLDETNLAAVLKAGAVNFCAVRAIMQSPDPEKVIRALQQIWRATV